MVGYVRARWRAVAVRERGDWWLVSRCGQPSSSHCPGGTQTGECDTSVLWLVYFDTGSLEVNRVIAFDK